MTDEKLTEKPVMTDEVTAWELSFPANPNDWHDMKAAVTTIRDAGISGAQQVDGKATKAATPAGSKTGRTL